MELLGAASRFGRAPPQQHECSPPSPPPSPLPPTHPPTHFHPTPPHSTPLLQVGLPDFTKLITVFFLLLLVPPPRPRVLLAYCYKQLATSTAPLHKSSAPGTAFSGPRTNLPLQGQASQETAAPMAPSSLPLHTQNLPLPGQASQDLATSVARKHKIFRSSNLSGLMFLLLPASKLLKRGARLHRPSRA